MFKHTVADEADPYPAFSSKNPAQLQGDPCGRGKDYVDIKFKVPSQAWVAGQTYS